MNREELINKIKEKKEFRELPQSLVERALNRISKGNLLDEEKIKLTRSLLRKVFSSFFYKGIFSFKDGNRKTKISLSSFPIILRKHVSTRERLPFYEELYKRIFDRTERTIIDLGSGVNGFSYSFLKNRVDYVGVEAVGQFVDMQNDYFKENKFSAKAIHLSLFELDRVRDLIRRTKKPRVVLMFKIVDALEVLERNYSKKFILEISKISEKIILSFPTKSLSNKSRFKVNRKWILEFLKENFSIKDDFEFGSERYLVLNRNVVLSNL